MPWFWTDELAELLTGLDDTDAVELGSARTGHWKTAPVGVWRDDSDPLAAARAALLDSSLVV